MATFSRSAYGRNPHSGRQNNNANGWTGAWPKGVPASELGEADMGEVSVTVQKRLVPLVETLAKATAAMGYRIRKGQTWGYANRPIGGTRTASNHSRGKAIDINSQENPQSAFHSEIPPEVVHMWEDCGWYWGGRYERATPDTMHFEYLGKPSDVAEDLRKAKAYLAKATAPKATTTKAESKPAAGPQLGRDVLREGARGGDVGMLQRFVGVDDDGIFGPVTAKAVRRWQKIRGYSPTGVLTERQGAVIRDALT